MSCPCKQTRNQHGTRNPHKGNAPNLRASRSASITFNENNAERYAKNGYPRSRTGHLDRDRNRDRRDARHRRHGKLLMLAGIEIAHPDPGERRPRARPRFHPAYSSRSPGRDRGHGRGALQPLIDTLQGNLKASGHGPKPSPGRPPQCPPPAAGGDRRAPAERSRLAHGDDRGDGEHQPSATVPGWTGSQANPRNSFIRAETASWTHGR